jgi:hypothetical protein
VSFALASADFSLSFPPSRSIPRCEAGRGPQSCGPTPHSASKSLTKQSLVFTINQLASTHTELHRICRSQPRCRRCRSESRDHARYRRTALRVVVTSSEEVRRRCRWRGRERETRVQDAENFFPFTNRVGAGIRGGGAQTWHAQAVRRHNGPSHAKERFPPLQNRHLSQQSDGARRFCDDPPSQWNELLF